MKVVDIKPSSDGKGFFGAWVELADEEGEPRRYRIVGADETDSARGWISVDSPVARALLGKSEGDVVKVRLPAGETEFEIVEVSYAALRS